MGFLDSLFFSFRFCFGRLGGAFRRILSFPFSFFFHRRMGGPRGFHFVSERRMRREEMGGGGNTSMGTGIIRRGGGGRGEGGGQVL